MVNHDDCRLIFPSVNTKVSTPSSTVPAAAAAVQRANSSDAQVASLQRALAESRAEIDGYQRTLALLRYRIADWLNGVARGAGPAHRGAKSLLATWFGERRA